MSNNPHYAVLDLGSNSFHLLIAQQDGQQLVYIDRVKDMVRLASYLTDEDSICEEGIHRALNSLEVIAERLHGIPPDNIRVIGTNTLRAAANAEHFLPRAEAIIGVPIEIISGDEEARLIWQGVSRDFTHSRYRRLVIDIGGGSTEFIVGRRKPRLRRSVYMGCVSFTKRFFADGNVTAKHYKKAVTASRSELQSLVKRYHADQWDKAIGASGTIRYILRLLKENQQADTTITLEGLRWLAGQLIDAETPDKLHITGVEKERMPVLPGGLAVLHGIFLELGIEELHVSEYSLKEGVIATLAGQTSMDEIHEKTVNHLVKKYRLDKPQGRRVEKLAVHLYHSLQDSQQQNNGDAPPHRQNKNVELLRWASRLHEIGLSIGYAGYHKHSGYIIEHTDMPGFSQSDQKTLSFLLLNHRRKLRQLEASYQFKPDWNLVLVLRLACLFNRRRINFSFPDIELKRDSKTGWTIKLPTWWMADHPLTEEDLSQESSYWKKQGFSLKLDALENQ